MADIHTGNVGSLAEKYKGWFMGSFVDPASPFHNEHVEIKWSQQPKGYVREAKGEGKPKNQFTFGILVYGRIRFTFVTENNKEIILAKEGDYVFEPAPINGPIAVGKGAFTADLQEIACRIVL